MWLLAILPLGISPARRIFVQVWLIVGQQLKARRASLSHSLFSKKEKNHIISLSLSPALVNIPLATISDLSRLAVLYMQAVRDWRGSCANCGFIFYKHDRYQRKTPLLGVIFFIKRVYCPGCKKAHALIPCFVFPYSRVLAAVKERAIRGLCFESETIEQLAELCEVEPATIKKWWENFRNAIEGLTAWLAGKLAATNRSATWLNLNAETPRQKGQRFFTLFGYYRSSYHPQFKGADFDLLCLLKPLTFLPDR